MQAEDHRQEMLLQLLRRLEMQMAELETLRADLLRLAGIGGYVERAGAPAGGGFTAGRGQAAAGAGSTARPAGPWKHFPAALDVVKDDL